MLPSVTRATAAFAAVATRVVARHTGAAAAAASAWQGRSSTPNLAVPGRSGHLGAAVLPVPLGQARSVFTATGAWCPPSAHKPTDGSDDGAEQPHQGVLPAEPREHASMLHAAVLHWEEQLQKALVQHGAVHEDVAAAMVKLAVATGARGDPQGEVDLLEEALQIQQRVIGRDDPRTAITMAHLGAALLTVDGDLDRAQQLLEHALLVQQTHPDGDFQSQIEALMSLATIRNVVGNPKSAQELLERALRVQEAHYGPKHEETADTLINLALVHGSQGNIDEQLELLERALPIQISYHGEDHEEVAFTLVDIGAAFLARDGPEAARPVLEKALESLEASAGYDSVKLVKCLVELGKAVGRQGDQAGQHFHFKRALEIREAAASKKRGTPPPDADEPQA